MRCSSLTNMIIPNLERNKCLAKKLCRYCPLLNKTGKLICSVTQIEHNTKINITCRSSNLIYCITCRKCKMQYVGQTKRTLKERFQGHLGKITKAHKGIKETQDLSRPEKPDPIGLHFSKPQHDETDVRISVLAFITLTPHSEQSLRMRLKVEKKWIHLMRCPAPYGLNIFDWTNSKSYADLEIEIWNTSSSLCANHGYPYLYLSNSHHLLTNRWLSRNVMHTHRNIKPVGYNKVTKNK